MRKPLEEDYFRWLYSLVASVRETSSRRTYYQLMSILHRREFVWLVPNDDNRVEEAKELREKFIDKMAIPDVPAEWKDLGASFLEVLIRLSDRLAFTAGGEPVEWFWIMLANIGLDNHTDATPYDEDQVVDTIDRVIWRTYDENGRGGLFPLSYPMIAGQDQREIELWYQFQAYLRRDQ